MRYIHVIIILLIVFIVSCNNTTEPPDNNKGKLILQKIDASCTEAWIKLTTENLQLPVEINIKRTDANSSSKDVIFYVSTEDTLLYVDSLLPKKAYQYQASSIPQSGRQNPVSSNEINVTTMDTTSHNFTFETFTFGGEIGSSVLHDVAIIDENNIWAVGELYIADSSQNGYTTYNAVHWDGNEWTLHRIMYYTICGQSNRSSYPAKSIIVFNENEIWIAGGGRQLARMNGEELLEIICPPFSININKLWGTSSSNIYAVGNGGKIAHYNGSQWQKIESGTDLPVRDIWGDYNEQTGEWMILAVGGNILHGHENERIILRIIGDKVQQLDSEGSDWSLSSIWFKNNRKYYIVGSGGKFQKNSLMDERWEHSNISSNYLLYKIRGKEFNQIAAAGAFGEVLYFNGVMWESYLNDTGLNYGIYYSITMENNLMAATGFDYQNAVITIGKRGN